MEDTITIIEGPPPTFEATHELWAQGLTDSPIFNEVVFTKVRTFNGKVLLERCINAWRENRTIQLEYRNMEGFQEKAPIVAARSVETEDGDMLLLWLRLPSDEIEISFSYTEEEEEDDEDWDEDVFDDDDLDEDDFDFLGLLGDDEDDV